MTISLFLEQVLNGIILGSIYALMGGGLALIYGTMRILNFAHGEFFMLGGFFLLMLFVGLGVSPWFAIPIAVVAIALLGALFERSTIHYLLKKPDSAFSTIAVTLGLSIVLQNVALILWGERFQPVPYFVKGTFVLDEIRIAYQRILILVTAVTSLAVMGWMLRYSRVGQAIRATSQDPEAATVMGISVERVHMITFGLGAGLAALAATMLSPLLAVNPWMGLPLLLKAFVVVILGGLGSFSGAILGGFILGVVEAVGMSLTSAEWRDAISYTFLIIFIWARPWGLFGIKER
jgi:branched-chain amino acid transport system permease protein